MLLDGKLLVVVVFGMAIIPLLAIPALVVFGLFMLVIYLLAERMGR